MFGFLAFIYIFTIYGIIKMGQIGFAYTCICTRIRL